MNNNADKFSVRFKKLLKIIEKHILNRKNSIVNFNSLFLFLKYSIIITKVRTDNKRNTNHIIAKSCNPKIFKTTSTSREMEEVIH